MKAEIKNYKRFAGHDGQGFEATLYLDGKRAAVISDDGWGGEWNWGIMPNMLPYIEEFRAKCEALPPMQTEWNNELGELDMDAVLWIEQNLLRIADAKSYAKGIVTYLDRNDGEIYKIPARKYMKKYHDLIVTQLETHHPTAQLINGMPVVATI